MNKFDDTITAISTPPGNGGISIVRMSGNDAFSIIDRIFEGTSNLSSAKSHTIHFGYITDSKGDTIDEVLVTVLRKPSTFTREDMIEINCHGGTYITRKILERTIETGARIAEPGEFTQRAFLNGRIDLTQAEAVADIIRAKTEVSHKVAIKQLKGGLKDKIESIRDRIVDILSLVELTIDFSEEEVEFPEKENLLNRTDSIINEIENLLQTAEEGRLIREGVIVVITGKPNVGKSSLLNAILKEERAIVTHIPGTTRDTIEEDIELNGILVRLIDTAGLRTPEDIVEQIGVNRSKSSVRKADLILFVVDASEELDEEDTRIMADLKDKNVLCVKNKIDLLKEGDSTPDVPFNSVTISATEKLGMDELHEELVDTIVKDKIVPEDHIVITKTRHKQALKKALDSMNEVKNSIQKDIFAEMVAVDLNGALQALGEIVGFTTSNDVLNRIFSDFCIGK